MRRPIVALIILAILTILPSTASGAQSPFAGAWEAVDLDGSHMTLTISGQASQVRFAFFDDSAGSCLNRGAPSGAATFAGSGNISGSTLVTSFDQIRCTGGIVIGTPGSSHTYTYHAETDTLSVDFDGTPGDETVWYRINSAAA